MVTIMFNAAQISTQDWGLNTSSAFPTGLAVGRGLYTLF